GTALALARWQGSAGAPVVAGAALAAAGGALAGALLGGTAWLLARELGARALVAWTWEHVHPTPAAGAPPPPARPLDPDRRGRFLAVVAAGRLADAAWWDAVPVVGPWLGAAATRRALKEDLYAARELAGMPRIVDTLQREVDAVAWARAAAASSAWVLLPAAAGLAAAGGLLLGAGPGALPAWAWAAGWGGLAAGAGVALAAAAAAWGTALLLEALAPWWLARAAAAGGVTPSLDRRLTAGRQAPRPRAGWGGRGV
ncbi:MAG: hypothetical protein HY904_21305, partial [Deltaproteobacteria bacterium]|nr:hypothetical protein [Deltaproteobacteria bacterium]